MAIIAVIQIVLFTVAMAQQISNETGLDDSQINLTPFNGPVLRRTICLLTSQPVAKRDDYTYTPGIGGHKVHTRAVTWNIARWTCEEEGGHLAIINSIAESNAITDLIQRVEKVTNYYFIGFHDLFQEGEYVTIHGQSLAKAGFTQWADGQPDNNWDGEHCGSVHKNGGFNDLGCATKYGFVCELPN